MQAPASALLCARGLGTPSLIQMFKFIGGPANFALLSDTHALGVLYGQLLKTMGEYPSRREQSSGSVVLRLCRTEAREGLP